ncbi:MSHA pilin protein MshD [Duganella sp. 1224]|uniref:type II secretion system protein n=1 Tax=Duganella sp. 1224 TaxID=2587052 RepID=UPI0015CD54EC|nr:type II secretion system protein [Duganella sp. 1224]NYE60459.1 MSHA pilin protein MshD [Duganella sp. 1224]
MRRDARRQRGLTIIELVIFIVIVGIAAAALVQVLNLASRNSVDPVRRKQAMLIAEAYMEEVMQAQFTACDPGDSNAANATVKADCANVPEDFGPETGNLNRPFDNINDYIPNPNQVGTPYRAFQATIGGNAVDVDVAGNPLGASAVGGTLGKSGLEGIVTTLTLDPVATLGNLSSSYANNNYDNVRILHITITTTYAPGQSIVLESYRTRYAPGAR